MIMENHLKISYSTREEDKQQQDKLEEDEDDDELEEEETEKLEEEVREIAKKVDEHRSTLPDHLESSISSYLSSQRPSFSLLDNDDNDNGNGSLPGPSSGPHSGARSGLGNSSAELEADGGVKNPDEVQLLRDKISSNVSAIPKVLKRMNDCISRIDLLVSSNERIPPAFKRKKS